MKGIPAPVIVVPGITASDLYDGYQMPPEAVWTTMRKRRYDRITLHPRGLRYEMLEPARVVPQGPFPLVYEDLIEELRVSLSEGQDGPVPVFPFGYDWRVTLNRIEDRLAEFVEEVIERTLMLEHYRNNELFVQKPTVNLVGHSMGGLIIAGYIERQLGWASSSGQAIGVNRVVTIGTPFRGSYEAILKVTTGTGDFGEESGRSRERRMARLTPALYHLLPDFEGSLNVDEGLETDIFFARAWQPNVEKSIDEQVREFGFTGPMLFDDMLREARLHRMRISALKLVDMDERVSVDQVGRDHWLSIVGVDAETRVSLRVRDLDGEPRFDLRSDERRNEWGSEDEEERRNTGDGTVPLEGAVAPFLEESRMVCVTPDDFGYWELRDRALSSVAGFHGVLPKMNMLHRLIRRFLIGMDDTYGSTWGRRMPGVKEWNPPLKLREKS